MWRKPKPSKSRNANNACVCLEEEEDLDWDTGYIEPTPKPEPMLMMKPALQWKRGPVWKPKGVPELMKHPEPELRRSPMWRLKLVSELKMKPQPQWKRAPVWRPKRIPELMMPDPRCRRNPMPKPKMMIKPEPQWKRGPVWKPKCIPRWNLEPRREPKRFRKRTWDLEPDSDPEAERDKKPKVQLESGGKNTLYSGETYLQPVNTRSMFFPWADYLGFTNRCCYFVPLKTGCYLICFFLFIWAAAEVVGADNQMANIFPDRGNAFYYVKLFYLIFCVGLVLATFLLLVGLIQERSLFIELYMYYVMPFCVLFTSFAVMSVVCVTMRRGRPGPRIARFVLTGVWLCLVAYFISVLNSYSTTTGPPLKGNNMAVSLTLLMFMGDGDCLSSGDRAAWNLQTCGKCYFCVTLKNAAIIICLLSFIWSLIELKQANEHAAAIFPRRCHATAYKLTYYTYLTLCVGFILATSVLLVGVLQTKYMLVNIFVWYAFFFNIASICVTLASALSSKIRLGCIPKRKLCTLLIAAVWACIFCRFIIVINTYKCTYTVPK